MKRKDIVTKKGIIMKKMIVKKEKNWWKITKNAMKEINLLKLINNSSSSNKGNHNREGGFDTRS